jgi:hypothetical protein
MRLDELPLPKGDLARLLFRQRQQVFHGRGRRFAVDHQDLSAFSETGHRREVLGCGVRQLAVKCSAAAWAVLLVTLME